MRTSIRISEGTKRKLEAVKRDDETYDELLARLVVGRTGADVEEFLGMAGSDDTEDHMKRTRNCRRRSALSVSDVLYFDNSVVRKAAKPSPDPARAVRERPP